MATPLTRIFLADIEASDLCPREHELGTCGLVALQTLVDGLPYGRPSQSQRSFPGPRWPSFPLQTPNFYPGNSELTIMLVDADPLQPRVGAPFCFGYVRLKEELAPLAYQHRLSFRQSLEGAPGGYGVLSFWVCSAGPAGPGPPALAEDADFPELSHPVDWCGVLRFSPEIRDPGPRGSPWSLEAAAGPPDDRGRLCPSSSFVSWHVQEEEGVGNHRTWMHWRHKQLFVVERDLLFSIRATSREVGWEGSCIQRLSKMRGPRGPCNMFTEAHPDPVLLKMPGAEVSVAMHLRFFPAEFLRPRSHAGGISIRITLLAAPPTLQLPVVFSVPSGCFSLSGDNAKDTIFHISRIGDCTEVCLSDPLRIVGRSVWKVSETGREATTWDELRPDTDCLVDILALRLRAGDDKVITLPLGDHTIVLRLCLTVLHVDIARPVLGVCVPALEPVEVPGGQGLGHSGHGQVVGIFVHALAVHSPQVTCCLLSGGPEAASAFYPLPHVGGKVFVPAQPDGRGKVKILAFLPEFGCHAATQTAVGDGCLQLHWRFSDGRATVIAAALVTFARWPAQGCFSAAQIRLRVLRTQIPEQALPHLVPLTFAVAGGSFEWSGEDGMPHDTVLSLAGPFGEPGALEVRSGQAMSTLLFLPELMSAQATGPGFAGQAPAAVAADPKQEADKERAKHKKKFAFDEGQGTLVAASSDSEDSRSSSRSATSSQEAETDGTAPSQLQIAPRAEAGTSQATLSLPTLVEKEHRGSCAFFFLPVRIQQLSEGPAQSSDATFKRLSKGTNAQTNGGVILLQQVSAIVDLADAHADSTCQGVWDPVPAVSLAASGSPGVAARSHCKASPKSRQGVAAAWSPVSELGRQNPPHILRAKFAAPSELELDLNLELRFCCTACNRALTLTAHGKVHVSTLWQPFDVHLSFESGSRAPAAGSRGAAFARVILCPSMLCNPTAGLLTLEVLPQYPGGPGVTELLEASEVHDAAHAVHDKPAGLRLLLDTDGSPALMLDGRTQDPATRQQLCVEVSSKDAMQNVLLEMQALSGARRILVSVCLAALGPLGDVPVLVHHLHFGSRCSLALLASFEARRHQVELRDSEVLKPLLPPPMVESKTFSGATDKEQKCHRLAEGLRRLPRPRAFVPSPARPQAEQIRRRRSNSVERVVSHPFLERGLHHWLAPSDPLVHKKPGHMWTQELGRKRPASAKATSRCGQAAARKPTGWDDASEARDGPKYRRDFLAQQHAKVWKLQEQLSRCHVEKERQEQRFGHVRRARAAAKQELNTRGHERKPGVRSSRNKDSRLKGEASTSLGPDRGPPLVAEQVCVVCGCLVPERSARYCAGCLPGTQREALDLRKSVGKSLATQASLQRRLEIQQEERTQLEVKHTDLEAKLYAAETGRPDSESEAAQQLMVLLTQLKTLKLDSEAQSRLDAERLEALQHREAVITAAHQEAQARYKKATRRHEDLQKQLDKGREKADMLLGKISSTAS
mmetsp:Transcript_10714/g.25301  ORF Transcript_10714/g.25301 Transcript_10714/m.25301 type:complete len:1483 (-) Transcript_10714:103-4551(-)